MTVLLQHDRLWKCPTCLITERTGNVPNRMHFCKAFGGMALPLIEVNDLDDTPDGRHIIVTREDYGDNRVAAINTVHGDGSNDCTVLAPTARVAIQRG